MDYFGFAVKDGKSQEDRVSLYLERSMAFFFYHVLRPFSCAIHTDVLTGNLPACFMELRLMLESLAKFYLADSKYPEQTFFQERLEVAHIHIRTLHLLAAIYDAFQKTDGVVQKLHRVKKPVG